VIHIVGSHLFFLFTIFLPIAVIVQVLIFAHTASAATETVHVSRSKTTHSESSKATHKEAAKPALTPLTDAQVRAAVSELQQRNLLIPIDGITADRMKGSFYEMRGASRHEAADILAARNTPVRAVEDGTIAKLFLSKFGGNTIYQIDPTNQYVYYYAHLETYEPSIKEGDKVKRGQVIGFVGTSGNAPPDTPHLHLSISILTPEKKWWQAHSIDPYEVFQHKK